MHIYLVISDAMLSSAVNSLWESLPPFSVSFRIHIKSGKKKLIYIRGPSAEIWRVKVRVSSEDPKKIM